MPAFGGTLRPKRAWLGGKAGWVSAGLAVAAVGVLLCAAVIRNTVDFDRTDALASVQHGSADLSKMESEVKEQLVEAAKRHALAKKHRMEALQLSATAEEDKQQALLLKRRSELAKREAELRRSENAVHSAQDTVKKLKDHAAQLDATADKDLSRADQDKEKIMELEDQAGTMNEKASEEADRIQTVESAERKAAENLPTMLANAKSDEARAQDLKETARQHMADSQRKAEAAKRLDALAEEKEKEAQIVRNQLMAILQEKTNTLNAKERDAAHEEALAKKDAQKAAEDAKQFASEAAEKAELAEEATDQAESMTPQEKGAEAETKMPEFHTKKQALHVAAQAKHSQAANEQPPSHHELQARRASNLERAGEEARRRRAERDVKPEEKGRETELAEAHERQAQLRGDEVGENDNGHLVVNRREALDNGMHLAEDGHYSNREENFKRALANAYRSGYEQHDQEGRQAELSMKPRAGVKPARFEMLGDPDTAEMLSKGPGDTVALEKESSAATDKAPMFTQLWYDPSSLKALTHSLDHTTQRMSKLAPHREDATVIPKTEDLYEDGHSSREERKFNRDMGRYRSALEQQRAEDLKRAARTAQELRQLPEGAEGAQLRGNQHAAESAMLKEPQDAWEQGEGRYSKTQRAALRHVGAGLRVSQDDDGHLVVDSGHEQSLDEFDEDGRRRGRGESPRLRRVERELSDSERRDDRLQRRVDHLQGEVDELRDSRRGRFEDLEEVHRHSVRRQAEGRRRAVRDEAERRVRQRFDERRGREEGRREERGQREERGRHAAVKGRDKKFSPDATYEKEYAWDPGHVSVGEIKFQHALKDFDRTKSILREGAMEDDQHMHMPELIPQHLPGQGL